MFNYEEREDLLDKLTNLTDAIDKQNLLLHELTDTMNYIAEEVIENAENSALLQEMDALQRKVAKYTEYYGA